MNAKIEKLREILIASHSIGDYKKYALVIIGAANQHDVLDDAHSHQTEASLILDPLVRYDFEYDDKLAQILELASLLDVPAPHDGGLDREKAWQQIVEIVDSL
ncbi:MAG: hypothetical protein WCO23_04335 [bacterium]